MEYTLDGIAVLGEPDEMDKDTYLRGGHGRSAREQVENGDAETGRQWHHQQHRGSR